VKLPAQELQGEGAAIVEKNKEIRDAQKKFADATVTFYSYVWNGLSEAVQDLVKADPEYAQAKDDARNFGI